MALWEVERRSRKSSCTDFVEELPERVVVTAAQVLEGLRRLGEESPGGELAEASEVPGEGILVTEALRQRLGPPTAVGDAPPIANINELVGDFWPEDEDPDDFTTAVRRWRDADRRFDTEADLSPDEDPRG